MSRRGFFDRLETSKEFTIHLIAITSSVFFLIILLLVVIFSREDLERLYNLLYLVAGFILGILGKGKIKNGI